jgi:hypothetical protein
VEMRGYLAGSLRFLKKLEFCWHPRLKPRS